MKYIRLLTAFLVLFAFGFITYAMAHPEASFPWDNNLTYMIYLLYFAITVLMLVISFRKK